MDPEVRLVTLDLRLVAMDQAEMLVRSISNKSLCKGDDDVKLIYIYSMHNEVERAALSRLREELGAYIVGEYDYQEVMEIIPVRATPAFLILRDDLQGDELLDGDAQLKITFEAYKAMEDEDIKLYQKETKRFDSMVNAEIAKAINSFKNEIKSVLSPTDSALLPQSIKNKIGI